MKGGRVMKVMNVNLGLNPGTIALGAAAFFLGPMVIAAAGGILRAVTKTGIKSGVMLYEKGKRIAAETKETIDDIAAEAKAEVSQKMKEKVEKK
jgi:hypothetical protein